MKLRHSLLALVAIGVIHFGCSSSDDDKSDTTSTTGEKGTAEVPTGASGVTDKDWSTKFAAEDGEGQTFIDGLMPGISGKDLSTDVDNIGSLDETTLRSSTCEPIVLSGSLADTDLDGIPDNMGHKYDCTVTQDNTKMTIKGTIEIQDKDNASKAGGYKQTISDLVYMFEYSIDGATIKSTSTVNGTFEVTVDGNTFTAKEDSTTTTDTPSIFGQPIVKTTNQTKSTFVYAADEDGNDDPFDKGTIKSISGTIHTKSEGTPVFDVTVGIKGVDLVKSSCQTGFESGSISFIDGNGNETKATFGSNCKATWTRNGANI